MPTTLNGNEDLLLSLYELLFFLLCFYIVMLQYVQEDDFMSSKLKNVTFSLPVEYIDKLRDYSKKKIIPSMNAGVRNALDDYFKKQEKKRIYETIKSASSDRLFLNDIDETMSAYKTIDEENSRRSEDW
jgi:hypothetical protein